MKLLKLLQEIISESQLMGLNEYEATWYEESRYIQELANPEMAYSYEEVDNNEWVFNDKYGNTIGVGFNNINKYFETFYIVKDLKGREIKIKLTLLHSRVGPTIDDLILGLRF